MQMIFETNIERCDFLEIALTPKELENILENGVNEEFTEGFYDKRTLNVFIRVLQEEPEEADSSFKKGKGKKKGKL